MNDQYNRMLQQTRLGGFAQPGLMQQQGNYDAMMQQLYNFQPQYEQQDPYGGYQQMVPDPYQEAQNSEPPQPPVYEPDGDNLRKILQRRIG